MTTDKRETASHSGYLFLFAGMTVVGSNVALSKPLFALMPVLPAARFRFVIGAVAMTGRLRAGPNDQPLSRGLLGTLFLQF